MTERETIPINVDLGVTSIRAPRFSDWCCDLFGEANHGITYTPHEGCEPNWFHRKMQELCFGVRWRKYR